MSLLLVSMSRSISPLLRGSRLISAPLNMFLISLPFSGVGVTWSDVFISFSIIPYLIFCLYSVRSTSLRSIPVLGILSAFFLFFCVFSNLFKNPISTYIFPLLLILVFCSVLFSKVYNRIDMSDLASALIISYLTLCITILIEISFYLIYGLNPPIYATLGIHGSTIEYFGIPRLRGFQLEPSILSYVSIFYFIAFNIIARKQYLSSFYTITPIVILMTTMSALGLLFFIYLVLSFILDGSFIRYMKKRFFSFILITLVFIVTVYYWWKPVYKVFEKIYNIYNVIQNYNLSGSVGYRVHSLLEPVYFFQSVDPLGKLTGTGFSNYSSYILNKYKDVEYSGFATGDLNSIFSAIAISTGLLGFSMFLFFIYYGFRDRSIGILSDRVFFFVLFLMISYGNLTAPFLWVMLVTLFFLKRARYR